MSEDDEDTGSSEEEARSSEVEDWVKRFNSHVGARIRTLRKERGWNQTVLGVKLGRTFQQVQKYERGMNRIPAGLLFYAALQLGVDPRTFLEGFPGLPSSWTDTGWEGPPPPRNKASLLLRISKAVERAIDEEEAETRKV